MWYYVAHKDYNKAAPFACDIAVVFVDRPIRFSKKTSKAVLVNTAAWMSTKEKNFKATGWGWTKVSIVIFVLYIIVSIKCIITIKNPLYLLI